MSEYSRKQKIEELWRRGVLAPWLLHTTQKKMYEAFKNSPHKIFVINCSRRLGKSFFIVVVALEHALQNPGADIKIGTPNQKMTRRILIPLMKQIMQDCPKHLRPKFRSIDGVYEFANGSTITVCGTEQGQVDGLRGTACDLIVLDEAGFITDLDYALGSVLLPQTLARPNARVILASTPPLSPDHAFVRLAQQAMSRGSYAKFTVYDNPRLTPCEIEELMLEAGGEDSTTWRREYLAEFITDRSMAIFPEATEEYVDSIIYEIKPPEFFIPITAIDLGYVDHTGILFGYYHFDLAKIVIQDEILINKVTSAKIVEMVREKERELWGSIEPAARIVDGNSLAIADLNETHGFRCYKPEKQDLEANVNRVRNDLANDRIIIDPRCSQLPTQLKYGTWDGAKKRFSRTSEGGHWDLLAALVYLCKHIDRTTNPYPIGYGFDPYTQFRMPSGRTNRHEEAIKRMFPYIFRQS